MKGVQLMYNCTLKKTASATVYDNPGFCFFVNWLTKFIDWAGWYYYHILHYPVGRKARIVLSSQDRARSSKTKRFFFNKCTPKTFLNIISHLTYLFFFNPNHTFDAFKLQKSLVINYKVVYSHIKNILNLNPNSHTTHWPYLTLTILARLLSYLTLF